MWKVLWWFMIVKHAILFSMFNGFYFPFWRFDINFLYTLYVLFADETGQASKGIFIMSVYAAKIYIYVWIHYIIWMMYNNKFERVCTSCNQINFENRVSWCLYVMVMVIDVTGVRQKPLPPPSSSRYYNGNNSKNTLTLSHSLSLSFDTPIECIPFFFYVYNLLYLLHCYQTNLTLYFLTGFYLAFCVFVYDF